MPKQSARRIALWVLLLILSGVGIALIVFPSFHPNGASRAAVPTQSDLPFPQTIPSSMASAAQVQAGPRLVSAGEQGVILDLFTTAFEKDEGTSADGPCSLLTVPGYGETDASGWPRLPVRGAMLGIPPGAEVSLTVLEAEMTDLGTGYEICPVPQPIVDMDLHGELRYHGVEAVRDPQAYVTDALYPASLAEVVATGQVRSQRVAQLQFHPFQYNPVTGHMVKYDRIRVAVDYSFPDGLRAPEGVAVPEASFEQILRGSLLNYEQARAWRLAPEASDSTTPASIAQEGPAYKVFVDQDGIYQITPADLVAAGVSDVGSINPQTFRLHAGGQEVDIYVAGEEDEAFDGDDYLLFYGHKTDTRYTDTNVYWLTWGGESGRRMTEIEGTPTGAAAVPTYFQTTARREKDLYYQSKIPSGEAGDHWFEGYVFASSGPAFMTYTITLEDLFTEPYSATLRGKLFGYSSFGPTPDHHTRVYLNRYSQLVDDAMWDGWRDYEFEQSIPESYLVEGTNVITLELRLSDLDPAVEYDIVFLNWFEIDYQRTYLAVGDILPFDGDKAGTWEFQVAGFSTADADIFDVTVPHSPVRILNAGVVDEGGSYTVAFEQTIDAEHHYLALTPARWLSPAGIEADVPSNLHSAANGADYLLITHGDFADEVQPLATGRMAQGLRTMVVDVQDIYDEFSYGVFDPQAIRGFLAYAYASWATPAPAYVLLVGDGHYDFKDNFGRGEANYVPPYLAYVDPWMGETAADNRFACVSGEDVFPDMHLGRLPVKTSAEAAAMVARILDFEQNRPTGDWRQHLLFVADNADSAGDFATMSDEMANSFVPATYVTETVYYKITHDDATEAKTAILEAINEGRLLVNYIGHASQAFWAFEHLLDRSDLPGLTNAGKLPLVVPMTCLEGYYIRPSSQETDRSCLAETFLRAPNGGAIASFSPTGMGVAMGHEYLNKGLFTALFYDGIHQLGPATTASKLYLYSNTGGYRDLLDTYLLFGDPALTLIGEPTVVPTGLSLTKTAAPASPWTPGQAITYTLAYVNNGPGMALDVVLSDDLPSGLVNPSVTSNGATVTPRPGSQFVWDVADLAPGDGGTVTITAQVDTGFTGVLTNTAYITTTSPDDDPADNWAQHVALVEASANWCYLPLVFRSADMP